MRISAKKPPTDPDEYREEHGRCPKGYSFDGEKCVKRSPGGGQDGPSGDAEDRTRGKGRGGAKKPRKGKSGKPKAKPKVKPQGPTEKVTKRNPYGLAKSIRQAKTLADIGGHEAITKLLGHMGPSKRPPPSIGPSTVKLDLDGDNDSKALMKWRDAGGQVQAAYTEPFLKRNAAKKWERVKKLEAKADKAIEKFGKAMQDTKATTKQRDAAAIMTIIGKTGLRPGSKSGLKRTGNRGISTLLADNVKIDGDTVSLEFVGKSGKTNRTSIKDPDVAQYLKAKLKGKGGDDMVFDASSKNLPGAMKAAGVGSFTPKDFRTRMAGKISADALSNVDDPPPLPKNKKKAKALIIKRIKEVSGIVAERLNNTPAMAKKAYIDPAIFKAWISAIGADRYLATAATKPTAEDLWKAALDITLPGADETVTIDPELEDDDQLDSTPMSVSDEPGDEEVEAVVVALLQAGRKDLVASYVADLLA